MKNTEVRIQNTEVRSQRSEVRGFYSGFWLLASVFCILFFSGCASTKDELAKNNDPALLYEEGLTDYQNGDYKGAIDRFKKVMEGYPLSPFAVDAELLLSDAYYAGAEYGDAASYYANFVSLHPNHPKASYALFQKGMSYFREISTIDRDQANTQKALLAFSDVASLYPASIYTDKAKEMIVFLKKQLAERELYIGNFYFKNKQYKGALARFAEVLKKYPDVGLSDKALYYIGMSYAELGEKELARDAFSTLIANFPNSSFVQDVKSWLNDNSEG